MDTSSITALIENAWGKKQRLAATLERHCKALEKKAVEFELKYHVPIGEVTKDELRNNDNAFWDYCAWDSKRESIADTEKRIADIDKRITELRQELDKAKAVDAFIRNDIPQVIKDFFENWKEQSISFFSKRYDEYRKLEVRLREQERAARIEAVKTLPEYAEYAEKADTMENYYLVNIHPRKPMDEYLKSRDLDYKSIQERKTVFAGPLVLSMCRYRDAAERKEYLTNEIDKEMRSKMLDLANRIGRIVGKITNAEHLHTQNGEIAGVIVGEKGKASVQTIGAGGYNIQRYHFRTLVREIAAEAELSQDGGDDEDDMEWG